MEYCISDIHGCAKTLRVLLYKLELKEDDWVYFLGDYIDRGPESKEVIDIVRSMPNCIALKGNHEALATDPYDYRTWLSNGGGDTLDSFGGDIPDDYFEWMQELPLSVQLPEFILAHAGLPSQLVGYQFRGEHHTLWDRYSEVDLAQTDGRKLICGHTPIHLSQIEWSIKNDAKINIDGGCVFNDPYFGGKYGQLVALCLDTLELITQENIE